MAWMLLGIGVAVFIAGLTTTLICQQIDDWADDGADGWLGHLLAIACLAFIGYPGAWLAFTHITGVGL